jgi:hypothetical protein
MRKPHSFKHTIFLTVEYTGSTSCNMFSNVFGISLSAEHPSVRLLTTAENVCWLQGVAAHMFVSQASIVPDIVVFSAFFTPARLGVSPGTIISGLKQAAASGLAAIVARAY